MLTINENSLRQPLLRALKYLTLESIKNHICVMKQFQTRASIRMPVGLCFRQRPAGYQQNFVVATLKSCKPTSLLNIILSFSEINLDQLSRYVISSESFPKIDVVLVFILSKVATLELRI